MALGVALLAVTVKRDEPDVVTEAGLKLPVIAPGALDREKVTAPLNPPEEVTLTM